MTQYRRLPQLRLAIPDDEVRNYLGGTSMDFGGTNIILEKVPGENSVLLQNYFDVTQNYSFRGTIIYYLNEKTASGLTLSYLRPDLPSLGPEQKIILANQIFPATRGIKKLAQKIADSFEIKKPEFIYLGGEKFDIR